MKNGRFRWQDVTAAIVAGVLLLAVACRGEDGPASPVKKDDFAGQTVKNGMFGMGLIQARAGNAPKVGQTAPDFSLKTSDGTRTVTLSSLRGKRPVVLIFGSFT